MRLVEFNVSEEKGDFVESVRSSARALFAPLTQGDSLELAVTKLVRPDDPSTSLDAFVVKPWTFSEIRFSLGYIDKAPASGSFKLRVDDDLTEVITWPAANADADAIASWKSGIVAKINAVAGAGAIRLDDDPTTPAHFVYLTWTDPADDREIALAENRLVPAIDTDQVVTVIQPLPAYQQLLKFIRLPLVETNAFAFPSLGAPTITGEVTGATGVNEVQIISIKTDALGAFDLTWRGARTSPLNITGLAAAQIASALNSVVADGASNPSFRVDARAAQQGTTKFAVSFIGPLAAAPQAYLVATALQQEAPLTAYGTIELRRAAFERALNGAASCTLQAEMVIVDGGGESTILREVTLLNDMTGPGTLGAIADSGGIIFVPTTVYVDESTADPFVTAAAGLSFTVPSAAVGANTISISHAFNSQLCGIRVHRLTGDGWVECRDTEYGNGAPNNTHVGVTFPFNFSSDPSSDLYYAKYKIFLTSPDATVQLAQFKTLWSDCLESLPSGQSVAAKFAAIDAALGVFGGTLRVQAGNIIGVIGSTQIDLSGVATSIVNQGTFSTALTNLFATNSTLVSSLIEQFATNTTFATTLATAITNNASITNAISNSLVTNNTFNETLRDIIYTALQSGSLPAGGTFFTLPDASFTYPPRIELDGPIYNKIVPKTTTTTSEQDGKTIVTVQVTDEVVATPSIQVLHQSLSPAITSPSVTGTISGELPATGTANQIYTVTSPGAWSRLNAAGRGRGQAFATGAKVTFALNHWYEVVNVGAIYYAREYEWLLCKHAVSAAQMAADSGARYSIDFPTTFLLESETGVEGRCELLCELGTRYADSAGNDVASIVYTALFSKEVELSPATLVTTGNVTIQRAADGTLTGSYTLFGKKTTFTPTSSAFDLRVRATKFDVPNVPDPRGSFSASCVKPIASIVSL